MSQARGRQAGYASFKAGPDELSRILRLSALIEAHSPGPSCRCAVGGDGVSAGCGCGQSPATSMQGEVWGGDIGPLFLLLLVLAYSFWRRTSRVLGMVMRGYRGGGGGVRAMWSTIHLELEGCPGLCRCGCGKD